MSASSSVLGSSVLNSSALNSSELRTPGLPSRTDRAVRTDRVNETDQTNETDRTDQTDQIHRSIQTDNVLSFERILVANEPRTALRVSGGLVSELAKPMNLSHVRRMCDDTGILEHAEGAIPRREHGYCTDDISRQLLVASLYPNDSLALAIAEQGLSFLRHAAMPKGRFRSRMNYARIWTDSGNSDDASGRAMWALGEAIASAPWLHVRETAISLFDQMCSFESGYWHANAFAALGVGSVLAEGHSNQRSEDLAVRLARSLRRVWTEKSVHDLRVGGPSLWVWPEARITYASAGLPDALLALSAVDESLFDDGLDLLRWLSNRVVRDGRFSPVPVDGLGPADPRPGFDQQPIEAQAFASASWRAWRLTGDITWLQMLVHACAWFVGANDTSMSMIDRDTNGCFDGLMRFGRNANQGAESTLAMLHSMALLRLAIDVGAVVLDTRAGPQAGTQSGPPADPGSDSSPRWART